nr:hypothetical protein [Tanacetum cinerariifolium]
MSKEVFQAKGDLIKSFYDDEEYSIQYKEYLENSSDAIAPVLPTEEPEYSFSMGYKHLNTTPETESNEIIKSSVEKLVPIPSECEDTLEDKSECDVLVIEDSFTFDVCENHCEILSDSNNDDILSDEDAFEDIEYVEASLLDSKLVSLEEENVVHQEDEDDHTEKTRSGSTTTHANNSLLEYDSFCFEIEPNSGEVISAVINNIHEFNEDECFDPGGSEDTIFDLGISI